MKQKIDLKAKAKRHADRMTDREDRRLTRLDQDLLAAIRASGGGWQTRVNQTLRKTFVRAGKRRTGW